MDLNTLQIFLDNYEIPKIKKKPKTFLGIAKQPHYENVLSNIYAFFFNVNEEHGMKDLFLKSFQELINETKIGESKKINLNTDFVIETEYNTDNNGRIDLLLYNDEQAIIVENKVYHYLNNDLKDYWDSVLPSATEENKIGIILSLKKYSQTEIYHSHFINITHHEFLSRVMENSGEYMLKAEDRYIVFLKDLYQNTINLSNYMEKDKIEFYYKHQEELNNAAKLKFAVRDFIKNEVKNACDSIDEKLNFYSPQSNSYNEKRLRYYVSPSCNDLMFTIIFEGLLDNTKELQIIIEVTGKAISKIKELKKEDFDSNEQKIILDDFYSNTSTSWAHFVEISFVLNENEIKDLQTFIKEKIEKQHFLSIYKKLEKHLLKDVVKK